MAGCVAVVVTAALSLVLAGTALGRARQYVGGALSSSEDLLRAGQTRRSATGMGGLPLFRRVHQLFVRVDEGWWAAVRVLTALELRCDHC